MYAFPVYVIHPILTNDILQISYSNSISYLAEKSMKSMVVTLFLLHCWWFYLFLKLAQRLLTQSAHAAGQAEYEGDSDGEHED